MKKIIIIFLLLISYNSYSQIGINKSFFGVSAVTDNVSAFGVSNKTYTEGKLYLFFAFTTGSTNAGTISGTTSSTWTSVASIGNSTRRMQIFRFLATSTITNETVNIGGFGGSISGSVAAIWEIAGIDQSGTNGSGAIVQVVDNSGSPSADPSITLAAISFHRNAVISVFLNDANPFGGTAESGWSEDSDIGYDTPTTGTYFMSRLTTTDNTPTVTASSSNWIGIAIELASSGRRIFNIN